MREWETTKYFEQNETSMQDRNVRGSFATAD